MPQQNWGQGFYEPMNNQFPRQGLRGIDPRLCGSPVDESGSSSLSPGYMPGLHVSRSFLHCIVIYYHLLQNEFNSSSLRILHDANHMSLMQSGNEAYMNIWTRNMQLESEISSKEYVTLSFNHIYAADKTH